MNKLLLSFYGDDFTGSTDAMESLALAGVRTVLFTNPPTLAQLDRYPDLQAFGVAGMTRSMPPDEMEKVLRPAFASLRDLGAPIVHYKVCSTFDSSPEIGSIGRVIDVGMDVFGAKFVPVLAAAPSLGRYCVFGNLFARCGSESEPFRLDRHPSMSRHPLTPMDEADLRIHLAKQTVRTIGLLDILALESADAIAVFRQMRSTCQVGLIDLLYESQLAKVGALLDECEKSAFIVGSSGVESALCAHWRASGNISGTARFEARVDVGPIIAICGSCSPVTAGQIRRAVEQGFSEITDLKSARNETIRALDLGRSVVIHSGRAEASSPHRIGEILGEILREVLEETTVRRIVVVGGDTSGAVARTLGIESLEMIGKLTRGAPLCRASAPGSPADGIEVVFKGGQIGPVDFFEMVRTGKSDA